MKKLIIVLIIFLMNISNGNAFNSENEKNIMNMSFDELLLQDFSQKTPMEQYENEHPNIKKNTKIKNIFNSVSTSKYKIKKEHLENYKQEINNAISEYSLSNKTKISNISQTATNLFNSYSLNKNNMKRNFEYINKLENWESDLNTLEFDLYVKLIDITDKYKNISNDVPATGHAGELCIFIYPYLKKNDINLEQLEKFSNNLDNTANQIENYKQQINNYSIEYENKKVSNLENKYYKKFKDIDDLLNFASYTGFIPNTNDLYLTRCRVIQILNNSFLAETMAGNGTVILIQTNTANKLRFNDLFLPYLPIKYTGKTFSYKNLYGEKRNTYIFREIYPEEYKKLSPIPQISENFYFIAKPEYSRNFTFVGLQNVQYPNTNGTIDRLYKKGY